MLQEKAMLVNLTIQKLEIKKTDKRVSEKVIADHHAKHDSGRFVKRILPEEAIGDILTIAGEARKYHYANTLAWTDEGPRLLPAKSFLPYNEKMRGLASQFYDGVAKFVSAYDDWIEEARRNLNGMFNQRDYPSKDAAESKFRFKLDFSPIPDSKDFRIDVAREELKTLQDELEERLNLAAKNARKEVYERLAEPLRAMVERLKDPEATFRDTLVGNLVEIVDKIPALNLSDDPVLQNLCIEARALTINSPNRLRDDKLTRAETHRKAQLILDKMSGYAV